MQSLSSVVDSDDACAAARPDSMSALATLGQTFERHVRLTTTLRSATVTRTSHVEGPAELTATESLDQHVWSAEQVRAFMSAHRDDDSDVLQDLMRQLDRERNYRRKAKRKARVNEQTGQLATLDREREQLKNA